MNYHDICRECNLNNNCLYQEEDEVEYCNIFKQEIGDYSDAQKDWCEQNKLDKKLGK